MTRSTRQVTRQQFSSRTTIDGNRIDRAASDVVARYNNVGKGDLRRRFVANQVVFGWMPSFSTYQSPLPFLSSNNDLAAYWLSGAVPDAGVQNKLRGKGVKWLDLNIDPLTDAPTFDQYLWTTVLNCQRPCILDALSFSLAVDSVFPFPYFYTLPLMEINIVAQVDNPYAPEDAAQSAVVLQRVNFKPEAELATAILPPVGVGTFPDMSPAHPAGVFRGMEFNAQRLNIPIPRGSRLRLILAIPGSAYPDPPNVNEWAQMVYSGSATLLESVTEV